MSQESQHVRSPDSEGPFVIAAMLCERVLVEQDGVKSAIRIVDRLIHQVIGPAPPGTMQPFVWPITLFISLKAGWIRGSRILDIRLEKPSGESLPVGIMSVFFEGEEDRGADVVLNLQLKVDMPGLHWFQVWFEDRMLSKIPLRIVYSPQFIQPPPTGGNP